MSSRFGLAFRLLLLGLFPVPYGEDAFGRIYFREQPVPEPPASPTQGSVVVSSRAGGGMVAIGILFALIGSLAGGAFFFYLSQFLNRAAASFGDLFLTLAPLMIILSLMPYQELPFLELLFAAFGFLGQGGKENLRLKSASILFGLACLTRYESWFLIPLLFLWTAFKAGDSGSGEQCPPSAHEKLE